MKTLTEFNAATLKLAHEKRAELTAAGKTPEELPVALQESLKFEGDKLTFVMNSLETIEGKSQNLKRVIVLSLTEGEKAPSGAVQKGDHYYMIEHYPPLPGERGARSGHGRGERGKRDDRGRGGKGGKPGERGERRPRRDAQATAPATGEAGAEARPPRNRTRRPPRGPRAEAAPQKPLAPGERLPLPKPLHPDKLLNKSAAASPAPATESAAAPAEATKSE